jgi:hypothetical protein
VTSAGDERLPPSIGGLVDLAFSAYFQRAPLYLGLAAIVFLLGCAVEFASAHYKNPELEALNLTLYQLFADAFVVATVALGTGTRVAGESLAAGALAAGALRRWMPVLGTMTVVQFVFQLTASSSGLGAIDDWSDVLFAPVVWLLWGALSLAAPLAALAAERAPRAMALALFRSLSLGLRVANLPRLCVVAFAGVVPLLLEEVVGDLLFQRHVPHAIFWANMPVDALVAGPLAALQTVFALDFARRAAARNP